MNAARRYILSSLVLAALSLHARASECRIRLEVQYESGEVEMPQDDKGKLLQAIADGSSAGSPKNDAYLYYVVVVSSAEVSEPAQREALAQQREAALLAVIAQAVVQPARVFSLISSPEDREREVKRTKASYAQLGVSYGCVGPHGEV